MLDAQTQLFTPQETVAGLRRALLRMRVGEAWRVDVRGEEACRAVNQESRGACGPGQIKLLNPTS